jgi:inorganic phosphate transporter, PiT family
VHLFGESIGVGSAFFLLLALLLALSFEFVNGFHDTANAVATVIYTHSLKATYAVVLSGCLNLLGVLLSSGAVAYSIVSLLPVELVLNVGSGAGFAMVFALLLAAIIWNLGTWWLGLPASSSHTLVGSIMGVGLANSLVSPDHVFGEGVNWTKAYDVFKALLLSPVIGFLAAGALLLLFKLIIRIPALYQSPDPVKGPPLWIRCLLIFTCSGVSFFHGSNDGQKGMGLIVLILVGIMPAAFALNPGAGPDDLQEIISHSKTIQPFLDKKAPLMQVQGQDAIDELSNYLKPSATVPSDRFWDSLAGMNREVDQKLEGKKRFQDLTSDQRGSLRRNLYLESEALTKLVKKKEITDPADMAAIKSLTSKFDTETKYIPTWVKVAVAFALGLGTMIGWKRIVVTVGEKIGKQHLTYAQGASAELVAMGCIGLADYYGLPVSTTHVLSSGVAGTMAANKSGLQMATVRNLLMAWVLTLPVCVLLGAALFSGSFYILFHWFGIK